MTIAGLVLAAALLAVLELVWVLPRARAEQADGADRPEPERPARVEAVLFTADFVEHRLRVLREELRRLDDDPRIFAKAFHTAAAVSAYQALLVDAAASPRTPAAVTVAVADGGARPTHGEVLDV